MRVGDDLWARIGVALPSRRATRTRSLLLALALDDETGWKIVVAEERPRTIAGTGVDAVIRARRVT
jgi:hypothetical protein